tara:strand:- start:1707 stop:3614 length:1908 start_codon:yes stop_codon:yes gene_type:complete
MESNRPAQVSASAAATPEIPLIGIAVWGWPGDGKTTSILTALHYGSPVSTPLGICKIRETDELADLATRPEYSRLSLLQLAKSSTDRLQELHERFIETCEWPDGNDSGQTYLVRVENQDETLAFAVLTDLPGGSYSENDQVADKVIRNSHAILMTVAPNRWAGDGLRARSYQDMVRYRIRRCIQLNIPIGVMITKSDCYPDEAEAIAQTIRDSIPSMSSTSEVMLATVSAVTDDRNPESPTNPKAAPPPAADREPNRLVATFAWTLDRAIKVGLENGASRVPVTALGQTAIPAQAQTMPILELRKKGDFSGIPGLALCGLGQSGDGCSFISVTPTGELMEVETLSDGSPPHVSNLGKVSDFEKLTTSRTLPEGQPRPEAWMPIQFRAPVRAKAFSSELVVARMVTPDVFLSGQPHDLVKKTSLPASIMAWDAVAEGLICGLDTDGRLHLFRRKADKYETLDYLDGLLEIGDSPAYCMYLASNQTIIAGTGAGSVAVKLSGESFGDRVKPPIDTSYDSLANPVLSSPSGTVAWVDSKDTVIISYSAGTHGCGTTLPDARTMVALAHTRPGAVAWVDANRRLQVSVQRGRERAMTSDKLAPQLPSVPLSLLWADGDKYLVATFGDSTWQLFSLHGAD